MAGQGKPPNPPQQAGQKRKSDSSSSDLSSKRHKSGPDATSKGKQNGASSRPGSTSKPGSGSGTKLTGSKPSGPKASSQSASSSRQRRTQSRRDARSLATQTTSSAFSNGALDVARFVKAREFEIRALQEGLARSKKARMERAFQSVPKEMRRRAGAWDVRRLPKGKARREKAKREVREDNTPTGRDRRKKKSREAWVRGETVRRLQNLGRGRRERQEREKQEKGGTKTRDARTRKDALREHGPVKSRFRKRQVNKTWLPTHLYHAKRAHMSSPLQPVWRFALPMTPTAKAYRPTHRAVSERGAVAWDVSYVSTVALEGTEGSLLGLLKGLGVDDSQLVGKKSQLWRDGRRSWQGWVYARDSSLQKPIAPITVLWRTMSEEERKIQEEVHEDSPKRPKRKLLLRVHPSAFHELWEEVIRLRRVQKPEVKAEDLRFDIGSIEITGPASTEALQAALWPISGPFDSAVDPACTLWQDLRGLDNPASLPANSMLSLKISDPRLHHPPQTVASSTTQAALLQTTCNFDNKMSPSPQPIFDSRTRRAAIATMQSQKAINSRNALSKPGSYPEPQSNDPSIPVLLYTSTASASASQKTASWTVLLPWKAIPAVWQSIMYYPVSTGGQVRFGGLREQRQLAFERCEAWFPGDYPGTEAGDVWEEREEAERKKTWEGRPRGRRVEYEGLELGNGEVGEKGKGWSCDWGYVLNGGKQPEGSDTKKAAKPWHCSPVLARALLKPKPATDETEQAVPAINTSQGTFAKAVESAEANVSTALTTVRISYLGRGTPKPAARIYRLPSDPKLRMEWLKLLADLTSKKKKAFMPPPNRLLPRPEAGGSEQADIKSLARQLLGLDEGEDGKDHPPVPRGEDLIGFVTSGGFNLREGKGTAVGSVGLERLREGRTMVEGWEGTGKEKESWRGVCVVRNSGEVVGRLARWEIV
ncbi:ribonucleases P/MRP protein subunit POP1-domain-containing protein [Elsinoe ampelina]|uniref:Ribonucleases P/MRP protein subunit POP1-domain-containing protein n=1 Tax=Elsinoe ampelina TaxID=302913 RepID=A0A6A6GNF7_9PEZI|nr:ribonucleases P/MRP protein subunit POP1-domain-containing protein [Elsinoe ampelina]